MNTKMYVLSFAMLFMVSLSYAQSSWKDKIDIVFSRDTKLSVQKGRDVYGRSTTLGLGYTHDFSKRWDLYVQPSLESSLLSSYGGDNRQNGDSQTSMVAVSMPLLLQYNFINKDNVKDFIGIGLNPKTRLFGKHRVYDNGTFKDVSGDMNRFALDAEFRIGQRTTKPSRFGIQYYSFGINYNLLGITKDMTKSVGVSFHLGF